MLRRCRFLLMSLAQGGAVAYAASGDRPVVLHKDGSAVTDRAVPIRRSNSEICSLPLLQEPERTGSLASRGAKIEEPGLPNSSARRFSRSHPTSRSGLACLIRRCTRRRPRRLLAQAHQDYMMATTPTQHSIPRSQSIQTVASRTEPSMYQVQPMRGHARFNALGLRHLHWNHWEAIQRPHGSSCEVRANGSVFSGSCDHVEVNVYKPESIGPAGSIFIYQATRVFHRYTRVEPYRYGYWYQPGLDY